MRLQELFESVTPGEYVYHAAYLPDLATGLRSVARRGLVPSREGYAGPGVYFAYEPEGGLYHVSADDAIMFRVRWDKLVQLFGLYPQNPRGIQRDDEQIIVPGVVPAGVLEVEYFPSEWWTVEDAAAMEKSP